MFNFGCFVGDDDDDGTLRKYTHMIYEKKLDEMCGRCKKSLK